MTAAETYRWQAFFPPGTSVLALPSWEHPRLLLPAERARVRWSTSALYPAFRPAARLYRWLLRLRATGWPVPARQADGDAWPIAAFVRPHLPGLRHVAVLVGTPGPAQTAAVQLRDAALEVIGYLKCAARPLARERLRCEHRLLKRLPSGIGPAPLRYGRMGTCDALLTAPMAGEPLAPGVPPPEALHTLLERMASITPGAPLPVEAHPWVARLRARSPVCVTPWIEPLADRPWPVIVQHGDLAPWNVLRDPSGRLAAVDWERGTLEGFPHLDLCHYVLQVAALVRRDTPAAATQLARRLLAEHGATDAHAVALARLAALDAYCRGEEEGLTPDHPAQRWRRTVWELDPSSNQPS